MTEKQQNPWDMLQNLPSHGLGVSVESSIPLFYRLYLVLQRGIREHAMQPGDRFPPEETIAAHFKVSRPTVNRAVQELIDQGWLTRQRGRGTFVRQNASTQLSTLSNNLSFSDDLEAMSTMRTIEPATPKDAAALAIDVGEDLCLIRRVHEKEDRIIMVCDSKLPLQRFPGLESTPLIGGRVLDTLRVTYGCTIQQAERCAEVAQVMDQQIADLLGVHLFAPILMVSGLVFDKEMRPIKAITAHIRDGVSFKSLVLSDAPHVIPQRPSCPRLSSPRSRAC